MHFININMEDVDKNRNTTLNYKKNMIESHTLKFMRKKLCCIAKMVLFIIHYLLRFHKIKSSDF